MTLYLKRLSQVQDELVAIGENVSYVDIVRISLKGFTLEWIPFIKGIVSRDKLPKSNMLWEEFIQEELWDEDIHLNKKDSDDDMALAVRIKGKKKELFE